MAWAEALLLLFIFAISPGASSRRKPLQFDSPDGDVPYKLVPVSSDANDKGEISLQFSLEQEQYELILRPSVGLLAQNYTHHLHTWDEVHGHKRRLSSDETPACFYRGKATVRSASTVAYGSAAMHTCWGGFSGAVIVGTQAVGLELAGRHLDKYSSDDKTHIVYRIEDLHSSSGDSFCGHSSHADTPKIGELGAPLLPLFDSPQAAQSGNGIKYVELIVVNDNARYSALDARGENAQISSAAVVNLVNLLYEGSALNPPVQVVLVAQHSFTEKDPYTLSIGTCKDCLSTEVGVNELLSKFESWLLTTTLEPYDNVQLFSGLDFESGVLGYAPVKTMCSPTYSTGIDQVDPADSYYSAAVIAHEMGHNFGMLHDGQENPCPVSGFIMNSRVAKDTPPKDFSSCSIGYFTQYIPTFPCLDNEPVTRWSAGTVTCGNGIVESNASITEACDCGRFGPGQTCAGTSDPCCDATNCQLLSSSDCSEKQGCCRNCKILPPGTMCRASRGECDVAEVCTGTNPSCPRDLMKGPGLPCMDAATSFTGVCYAGGCVSHDQQCRAIGVHFNNSQYTACPRSSQLDFNGGRFCDTLYCLKDGQCSKFQLSGAVEQVADGVSCGDGEQCYNGNCITSRSLPANARWMQGTWQPQTCDCGDTQQNTRQCVLRGELNDTVDSVYCPYPAPEVSRPCITCKTPNVLLDIGSQILDKFKTTQTMEALRSLIPRFNFPTEFDPTNPDYQMGLGILAIPGALVVLFSTICSCWRSKPPKPQRGRMTPWQQWGPSMMLIGMGLTMFIFIILGLYYNALLEASLFNEESGAHPSIVGALDSTMELSSTLHDSLVSINNTLPGVTRQLQNLLQPVDFSIVDAMKATAEFYKNYVPPVIEGKTYSCTYCGNLQAVIVELLQTLENDPSWKNVVALDYTVRTINEGIVDAQDEIVASINLVDVVIGKVTDQVTPTRSRVDAAKASYQIYETIRMIVVYVALLIMAVPVVFIFVAHPCKKPRCFQRARSWSMEVVFLCGLLLGVYLPLCVAVDDSCHTLATLEGNLTGLVPDPKTAIVVQTCLTNGPLLEALNKSGLAGIDVMALDEMTKLNLELPNDSTNMSFAAPLNTLTDKQNQIKSVTLEMMFSVRSQDLTPGARNELENQLRILQDRPLQLNDPANRLVNSAQRIIAAFPQVNQIMAPVMDAGRSFENSANCRPIAEEYTKFKVAWCESANTSVTFFALVCLLLIIFSCIVIWVAPKAVVALTILTANRDPDAQGGYVPLAETDSVSNRASAPH